MCPFIGKDYGSKSKRILLLGESHYVPAGSIASRDPKCWYSGSEKTLAGNEIEYISTFSMINERKGQKMGARAWRYYLDMEHSLIEAGFPRTENMFQYVSFMNAFLRPAVEAGGSLAITKIDIDESVKVLKQVFSIIKPEVVIFLTKNAGNALQERVEQDDIEILVACHTTSSWWNRDTTGRGTPRAQCVTALRSARII